MEAGLAFLWLDDEVLEFPRLDRWLRRSFTARLCGFWLFSARRFNFRDWLFRDGGRGFRFDGRLGAVRCVAVMAALGAWDGDAGAWCELLSLAFTEYFFECFEHGHLVNLVKECTPASVMQESGAA